MAYWVNAAGEYQGILNPPVDPTWTEVPDAPEDNLQIWDFVNSAWTWPDEALKGRARSAADAKRAEGITFGDLTINSATMSQADFLPLLFKAHLVQVMQLTGNVPHSTTTGVFLQQTAEQFSDMLLAIAAFYQKIDDVVAQVYDDIDNDVITTGSGVASAFSSYWSSYDDERLTVEIFSALQSITDVSDQLDAIRGVVFNNNVSRSLNSAFTISTTKLARVSYSVRVSWSVAALLSGSATAFLEYSTDGGTTWITVNQVSKNIGLLTFAGADDLNLVGEIPANASTRIRTTSSNMTVAFTRGQEVLALA